MKINKKYILPNRCLRGIDCMPLSLIVDKSKGFLCCGINKKRNETIDIFTHCFKNELTDTRFDMSKQDLLSTISIFGMALNIELALKRGERN